MSQIDQHEQFIAQLFTEIGAVKLMLHALIKGVLPEDQAESWKEIEAIVRHIEMLAGHARIEGTNTDAAEVITERAKDSAIAFVRTVGPVMKRN